MKAYVKPELFFESFELSQHIALCAWDMSNNQDAYNCTAEGDVSFSVPQITIFTEAPRCNTAVKYEDYCYTNGSGQASVFNS